MDDATPSARRPWLDWRILAGLNLALAALLWFMDCTDYSWANNLADGLFGPLVAAVALKSLSAAGSRLGQRQRLAQVACLPSLLEGGMQVALAVLLLVPPCRLLWGMYTTKCP